ncbi:MAG TPA: selenocysteine-specific translation elongation factor [Myxococcales bacterium]|nr:selenocysteine-specific translation elongation factor [Myxococcales bacterium]
MKAVIVGTAGHIDHGKSALVRALTGTDPDRLEEEKRRGITIDIGFAHLDLAAPDGEPLRLGFVDVPGHERFVRNMLAGIGGIDIVLLVIAADEGVKPQTREHFDICRLLAVGRGITVLTKADLVDDDTLQVVTLEAADFLRGSFLDPSGLDPSGLDPARSPIVAVSSRTGRGLDQLRAELACLAAEIPAKDSSAAFRLPIDRVFTMKGFGTVVTGTLISGTVQREQELQVHPIGRRVRVRGVQVHGAAAEHAFAGQRTALNLAGVEVAELARGMMLTAPQLFRPVTRVSVMIDLLHSHPIAPTAGATGTPGSAKPLADRSRVHFHAFTAETIAEVHLLGGKRLPPGESGLAELKLDDPLLLAPGDRFIIRQFSPVVTIGGGRVLDAVAPARRARLQERQAFLARIATAGAGAPPAGGNAVGAPSFSPSRERMGAHNELQVRVERRGAHGLSLAEAVAETGWLPKQVERVAGEAVASGTVARFADRLLAARMVESLGREMLAKVEAFHQANPLQAGISKEALRESLGLRAEVFAGVLDKLVREKSLQVSGEVVHAAGKGVVLRDEEAESKAQIERAFRDTGLKVPLLKDVLASLPVDKVRAQKIVTLLLRDRVLVKLSDELVFHRDALAAMRARIVAQKSATPKINVGTFKDLFGITRKYAIPLLEYLDRERVTRRVGDERIIL